MVTILKDGFRIRHFQYRSLWWLYLMPSPHRGRQPFNVEGRQRIGRPDAFRGTPVPPLTGSVP
ncbi:hypothetical protein [Microtetraspora fusca]|uniref:hypothetical protein n=1 Tax=Microtetraspora fusca TaxID=1997 RepID=UPI000AC9D4D9|nr:hypothetical protein [Microtetraspora fusca]